MLNVGKWAMAWKEYCAEYWCTELQKGIDRCIGLPNKAKICIPVKQHSTPYNQLKNQPSVDKYC